MLSSYHNNLISAMFGAGYNLRFGRIITQDARAVSGQDFTLGVGYIYFGLSGWPVVFESRVLEVLADVNETRLVPLSHRFFVETLADLSFPPGQKYSLVNTPKFDTTRKAVRLIFQPEDLGPYSYALELARAVSEIFPEHFSAHLIPMEAAQGFDIEMIQPGLPYISDHLNYYRVAVPELYRNDPLAWYLPQ